jgi:hypothetical protein
LVGLGLSRWKGREAVSRLSYCHEAMVLVTYVIPISKFTSLNSIEWLCEGICEDLDGTCQLGRKREGGR